MIQGYPDDASAFPGDTIVVRVSTDAPWFRIDAYRQGVTLKSVSSSGWLVGTFAADHRNEDDWGKNGIAPDGNFAAGWTAFRYDIPGDWPSGVYILMFVEGDANQAPRPPLPDTSTADARTGKAMIVVKNPQPGIISEVLYKVPLFTYQAYNALGGNSIYQGHDVHFHRPGGGTGGTPWDAWNFDPFDGTSSPRQVFAHWDAPFIAWLESAGYRIDYCTDLDVHRDGMALLANYALILSVGHDEYYSEPMRDALETFRDAGGNIAFFSGNTCWWRVEFDQADRLLMLGQQTIQNWSGGLGRPEDSLTGVSYRNAGEGDQARPRVGYTAQHTEQWPFEGTGLHQGDAVGDRDGIVGYECDGAPCSVPGPLPIEPTFNNPNDGTPGSLMILGTADTSPFNGPKGNRIATMAMYTQSGTIFTGATTDWPRVAVLDQSVGRVTKNVVDRLGGNPKGLAALGNVANLICCDGFFSADDNFRHAIIATGDGAIREFPYPPAVGQPPGIGTFLNGVIDIGGFTSDDDRFRHIVAVDFQNNIWDIAWDNKTPPILQILVNIPNAIRVAGFYTADDQFRHAIVGTSDGNIIEVYYAGLANPNPRTAPLGNFTNLVDVGGFFSPDDGYRHAMVGTADGTITEIFYNPDFGIFQTPVATVPDLARVSGYYADGDSFFNRRVQALTNGGRIHEVRYSPAFGVMRAVLFNPGTLVDLGGFYSNDDNYRHSILATPGGDVQELFFVP